MSTGYAELHMYTAPDAIHAANEAWLALILERLGAQRLPAQHLPLHALFESPQLLFTQTCGYPLMTALRGRVQVIGRPAYDLPDSYDGSHCSLLLVRQDDPRETLTELHGCRGAINNEDSNTGMNLLRHTLAPWQRDGRFFSSLALSGGHRNSLRLLREGVVDLVAVDSVTYAYLARAGSEEVAGLRILARSAPSPTLPYIGPASLTAEQAGQIRSVLNQTLHEHPDIAATLAISQVLPVSEEDYQVLLDYQNQARQRGLAHLEPTL
ncbi:phosphate/phosphite/phosphonate ABC transporter substrate-binding protein [Aquipseudomonas campi]